jgi:hypothetical protein
MGISLTMIMSIYKIIFIYLIFMRGKLKILEILLIFERHIMFPIVYCLVELALILPLAIERAFSLMKIIKTKLHNKISVRNSWWIEYVLHRGRDVQTSSSIKLWKIFKTMVELCQCIWLLYIIKASLLICFRLYLCSDIYVLISIVLIDYIKIICRINVLGLFWPLHDF